MSSKWKNTRKSVATQGNRFVNRAAQEAFVKIQTQPVIYERGFIMETRLWSANYVTQIQAQGWDSFCHPCEEVILPWVFEFYANACFHHHDVAFVRGKEINFSPDAINDYFALNTREMDEYSTLKSTLSPHDITIVICANTEDPWANKKKFVFKTSSLSREANVWLMFVNSNLLPTKNSTRVSLDRALLIYSITQRSTINVGKIIAEQLRAKVLSTKGSQLWFPTFITALCRQARVIAGERDIVTLVGHHITHPVISAYVKVSRELDEEESGQKIPPVTSKAADKNPEASSSNIPNPTHISTSDVDHMIEYLRYTAGFQRLHHLKTNAHM